MIGTTVLYKLAAFDVALINARRDDARAYARKHRGTSAPEIEPGDPGRTGHVEHVGNHVNEGDVFPAFVVADFSHGDPSGSKNLHVLLDGNDTYWATSRVEGTEPSQWTRLP